MSVQTPAVLERARVLTLPVLRASIRRLEPSIARVAAYHLGWVDVEGRPVAGNGGKAIRPALAVLSAEAVGSDAEVALPGAVAVELVHNFSLLHDDLMDGDEERRHRPTSWKVFGPAMAILAGDALLALAEDVLLEAPAETGPRAARHLTEATDRLITGQAEDLSFEGRLDVSVHECLTMAGNKTGALLACSASIGSVLAGAPTEATEALSGFGHHLGLAFQAVDDLLGIWGEPGVTGKPAWSDLRQRKKSVPVAHALSSGGRVAERLAGLLGEPGGVRGTPGGFAGESGGVRGTQGGFPGGSGRPAGARAAEGGPRLSDEDLALAAKLVQEAGGRDWTMAEAERQLGLALERLDSVAAPERTRDELVGLARFVTTREL
jgi:geranylgeranyl diphosphate synthase type I